MKHRETERATARHHRSKLERFVYRHRFVIVLCLTVGGAVAGLILALLLRH